ncbi:hypothetical protein [Amycolatopsis thermophila]|uniref:Uncharacterized protein n=1 Tax=Amycolatopsis thermophila TaxID=206084 RepID=A0ABU0EXJ9_9PSEU|nr:hypothetical protein [Amycolatopsis thermophila]MDQ0380056.1 hypothetical protein [Amycolatopsis thermophila]
MVDPHTQADRYAEATEAAPAADLHTPGRLGDDVVAQVACAPGRHLQRRAPDPRVDRARRRPHRPASPAKPDLTTADLLDRALRRTDPHPVDGGLVPDVTGLRFLDYESLSHPVGAGERGWTLVPRTAWAGVTRLVGLLGVPSVRVEAIV